MDRSERVRLSKRLAYHLRHDPRAAGIELDEAGWAPLAELLDGLGGVDREAVVAVVTTSPKQRFELSDDGARIRARYGHSVPVDPGHEPATPPDVLYHGTARDRASSIRRDGLRRMGRRQVHLSEAHEDARQVGARHGAPEVLEVDARRMHDDGFRFTRATDGVWLVDDVPPEYVGGT